MYYNECGDPLPHFKNHVNVTKEGPSGRERVVHWCSTVRQAEKWIAKRAMRSDKDMQEVWQGLYSISPDRVAIARYNKLRARQV
jgi:hypothetical protein